MKLLRMYPEVIPTVMNKSKWFDTEAKIAEREGILIELFEDFPLQVTQAITECFINQSTLKESVSSIIKTSDSKNRAELLISQIILDESISDYDYLRGSDNIKLSDDEFVIEISKFIRNRYLLQTNNILHKLYENYINYLVENFNVFYNEAFYIVYPNI